jgi:hypothetical protein
MQTDRHLHKLTIGPKDIRERESPIKLLHCPDMFSKGKSDRSHDGKSRSAETGIRGQSGASGGLRIQGTSGANQAGGCAHSGAGRNVVGGVTSSVASSSSVSASTALYQHTEKDEQMLQYSQCILAGDTGSRAGHNSGSDLELGALGQDGVELGGALDQIEAVALADGEVGRRWVDTEGAQFTINEGSELRVSERHQLCGG